MATRPIFLPLTDTTVGAKEVQVEFTWHPGMATSQKQKSIQSLHAAAECMGISPVLEISSKSESSLGVALSAFNLSITTKISKSVFTVETAFQGSKVFEKGGPYRDLIGQDSFAAKKDIRLKESGNIIGFDFYGRAFPISPRTFFYDWLYINALNQNVDLAASIADYAGFSDIEFNPSRSLACQARSAALFASLVSSNMLHTALESTDKFLELTREHYKSRTQEHFIQGSIV